MKGMDLSGSWSTTTVPSTISATRYRSNGTEQLRYEVAGSAKNARTKFSLNKLMALLRTVIAVTAFLGDD